MAAAADGALEMEEDDHATEEGSFIQEDVLAILKESVDGVLGNATYSHTKVKQWTSMVCEKARGRPPLPLFPILLLRVLPRPLTTLCAPFLIFFGCRSASRTASRSSRSSTSRSSTL